MARSRNAVKSGRNTRSGVLTGAEGRAERAAQRAIMQAEHITSATPPSSPEPSPPLEDVRKCPTEQDVPPAPPAPPCNASGDGSPEGEGIDKARPTSSSNSSDKTHVTSWRAGSRGSMGDLSLSGGSLLDKLKEVEQGEQAGQQVQGDDILPQSDVQPDKATSHGPPSASPSATMMEEEQQHASPGMGPSVDASKDADPPLAVTVLPPQDVSAPEDQGHVMPKVEEGKPLMDPQGNCITPTLDDQRDGHEQSLHVPPKRLSALASSFVPVTLPDGINTGGVSCGSVSPHYDDTALLPAQMEHDHEGQKMTDQQAGGYDAQQWHHHYDEQAQQHCFSHGSSSDMYPPQQYPDNTQMPMCHQYEQAALQYGHQPQALSQCQAPYPPPQGYLAPPPTVYDNNGYGVPMPHLQHEQGFNHTWQQLAYSCPPSTGGYGNMAHLPYPDPNEALYAHQHQQAMWHYEQQQQQHAMWEYHQQQQWEYEHQQAMMMAQHQYGDSVYDVHSGHWYPAWQYQPYECSNNYDVYPGMGPCAVVPEAVLPMGVERTPRRRRRHRGGKGARANRAAVAY